MTEEMLTLDKFEEASEVVKKVTQETKLVYSDYLSAQTGNKVYLKPENMQFTGAYKVRGAYYKLSTLTDEERKKGLITASAGNHAQGVAYAAKCYGVKAVIVMPNTTPLIKVNRTKSYGAEVVLFGDVYDEACAHAYELAEENGYTFIHPFDDLAVATGQGTIAMEIFKELPLVDYILVPIGGGGLATGVSTLAKLLNPKIKVIGVEPAGANCLQVSIKEGKVKGKTKFITTRFGNVLGSNGSVIPRFKEQIENGGPVTVTHPDIIRYFMTIPEACRLVMEAGMMGKGNEIFVFEMGEPVRIVDLAIRMIELAGYRLDEDIKIEFTGLRPGEKLYEELLSTEENTLPTSNKKIKIAKVRRYEYDDVLDSYSDFETLVRNVRIMDTVALMKKIVPEFISKNSRFEVLDKKEG